MIRRPPISTLFPTRRSSDLERELKRDDRAAFGAGRSHLRQTWHLSELSLQRRGHTRCHYVGTGARIERRSEEHTSELQSLRHLVCRLLLEKKKKNKQIKMTNITKRKLDSIKDNRLTNLRKADTQTHEKKKKANRYRARGRTDHVVYSIENM